MDWQLAQGGHRQNGSVGTRSRVVPLDPLAREWKDRDPGVTGSSPHPRPPLLQTTDDQQRDNSVLRPFSTSPTMDVLPRVSSFASLSSAHDSPSHFADTPRSPKVRFDHDCVVIPDPVPSSRLPRLVTKSYTLPLWKRKRDPSQFSESEDEPSEDHVVFKVSVPRSVYSPFPSLAQLTLPPVPFILPPASQPKPAPLPANHLNLLSFLASSTRTPRPPPLPHAGPALGAHPYHSQWPPTLSPSPCAHAAPNAILQSTSASAKAITGRFTSPAAPSAAASPSPMHTPPLALTIASATQCLASTLLSLWTK